MLKNKPLFNFSFLLFFCLYLFGLQLYGQGIFQSDSSVYKNPVLPGFHPDPSITRVEDDYYLVTSSFEFWPALPVYHSKDLVNWEITGHVVSRKEQIDMKGIQTSSGFYAPTIRYNQGTFYVAVSYVTKKDSFNVQNMIFTNNDIRNQKWSKPHIITNGTKWKIDPDLFFDDNGKVYFSANAQQKKYPDVGWRRKICTQELDIDKWKLKGKRHTISKGAMKDAVAAEAPHIYKKDGYYYLILAEGGTGMGHAVTVFRSKEVFGPYENYNFNPVLTHRHLANTAYIQNTGHADLIKTQKGDWWMVCLGVRNLPGIGSPLGRETFLVPVKWPENSYPIVNPSEGMVPLKDNTPELKRKNHVLPPGVTDFNAGQLPLHWNIIRNTRKPYQLKNEKLHLSVLPETLDDFVTPAFTGRRVQHHNFEVTTKMKFMPESDSEEAGISLMLNEKRGYYLLLSKKEDNYKIMLKKGSKNKPLSSQILADDVKGNWLYLRIISHNHRYRFLYSEDGQKWNILAKNISGKHLNTPWWIFTGTYTGLYATSNGEKTNNKAIFDWFSYRGL